MSPKHAKPEPPEEAAVAPAEPAPRSCSARRSTRRSARRSAPSEPTPDVPASEVTPRREHCQVPRTAARAGALCRLHPGHCPGVGPSRRSHRRVRARWLHQQSRLRRPAAAPTPAGAPTSAGRPRHPPRPRPPPPARPAARRHDVRAVAACARAGCGAFLAVLGIALVGWLIVSMRPVRHRRHPTAHPHTDRRSPSSSTLLIQVRNDADLGADNMVAGVGGGLPAAQLLVPSRLIVDVPGAGQQTLGPERTAAGPLGLAGRPVGPARPAHRRDPEPGPAGAGWDGRLRRRHHGRRRQAHHRDRRGDAGRDGRRAGRDPDPRRQPGRHLRAGVAAR